MSIEKNEIGTSILKTILAGVSVTHPVLGVVLSETLMDYWSRVKVERMVLFTEKMKEYFDALSEDEIDVEFLRSEDFAQFFELVLRKVSETKSKRKIEIFRDILIGQLKVKGVGDFSSIFLNLIQQLTEKQIEIMQGLSIIYYRNDKYKASYDELKNQISVKKEIVKSEAKDRAHGFANNYDKELNDLTRLEEEKSSLENHINEVEKMRKHNYYKIPSEEFEFYLRDLIGKGLIYDVGVGTYGSPTLAFVNLTQMGNKFLEFIKLNQTN